MRLLLARALAFATSVMAIGAASIAGAPPAFAGNNGQHLNIHDGPSTLSVGIGGTNQYGTYSVAYVNTPGPWTKQYWWWKYYVNLRSWSGYNGLGSFLGQRRPYVPRRYAYGDFWRVYAY